MTSTFLSQIGVLLALLITIGGLLALHSVDEEKAERRFFLYLLVVGSVLLLILFVAIQLTPAQDNRPFWQVMTLLTPAFIGVLALIVLRGKQFLAMGRAAQLLAMIVAVGLLVILVAGLIGIVVVYSNIRVDAIYRVLPGFLVLVLGWTVAYRRKKTAVFIAILLLFGLFGFNALLNAPDWSISQLPDWLGLPIGIMLYALPALMVVMSAVLIKHGLQSRDVKRALLPMLLALVSVAYLTYTIFWTSIWDHTSDGLGGLVLSEMAAPTAAGAGMVLAVALIGWRRSAGLLFTLLTPLLLYQAFEQGWQVSYHDLTEARAERIGQALDDYYQREGVYPEALDALTPRDMLRIPQPVLLRGETWCFQGGDDFYRLGAFSREFFSMPVELTVYETVGEPDSVWACENQLAAMKERYYSPMEDPAAMQPPPPTPLPPSETAQGAETITPLLDENNMLWGSWSPDSAYFLLGQGDGAGGATISFLDGQSGELCAATGTYSFQPFTANLREHHAWLPDGQLLLVDESGQIVRLSPCEAGVQKITLDSEEPLEEIMAQDDTGGRILLKSATEFWIFDGRRMTWQLVPGITPNPYEAHWDNAAWQPDGGLLAISRLNGRDASEGSTLYIIAGDSGQVIHTLPLAEASDQSAPRVDWLSPQELMLGGAGVLRILDFSTDPAQPTDVLAGIFGLDLEYPDELWGNGWQVDWEDGRYSLTVQPNHPRNQALYLYESATGTVDVYDEDSNVLLLFPNGQMEQWMEPDRESEPEVADEFVFIDVAERKVHPPLTISGHSPRDYPRLSMAYLAESKELAVASSQGISIHTLPGGEMAHFWTLAGQGFAPYLLPAPDGSALVAVRDQGGVYWLPLE